MSQFDMDIAYNKGDENCVTNALSWLPPPKLDQTPHYHNVWANPSINAILTLTTNKAVLADIIAGYQTDPFCTKLV